MGELKLANTYSIAEYFELDKTTEMRYEYVWGEIYAMAGGTFAHNEISGNLYIALKMALKGKKCKAFINDVRTEIVKDGIYYYPDVVVTCSESDLQNKKIAKEPSLVAEVLSESTEANDLGKKLFRYMQVPSLEYYLIISQEKPIVYLYHKIAGDWRITIYDQLTDSFSLPTWDLVMQLSEIYEGVELAEENKKEE